MIQLSDGGFSVFCVKGTLSADGSAITFCDFEKRLLITLRQLVSTFEGNSQTAFLLPRE
jgi:hypothetical protein